MENGASSANKTTSVSSSLQRETEYLATLINYAIENQFSVAVWRLPNDPVKHIVISRKPQLLKREATVLEELEQGFIFAPFDRNSDTIFLPADYKFTFTDGTLRAPEHPIETTSHTWFEEKFQRVVQSKATAFHHTKNTAANSPTVADYISLVTTGIQEIEKGIMEKIVPSRTKVIDLPLEFDIVQSFQNLCRSYPNALISFVSSPETGSWLGATPEVLVGVEDKSIFRTVALAGTQPYQEGINLKSVAWTQKEIEEQALVERYVISCFKKIRVREYDEHGPKTVVAGNLMHLKSDFTVDMKAIDFPQLGSVMLQLLHPTSAVCGMPLEPALEFLKKHEGYNRQFYAGFLGPVNVSGNTNIFVNLRCMQLLDSKAILYAGAGVTIDSIPEREWSETEIKFNTMLNILK
ncbi:MAG TPA: chorismate-binding protein [Ohtaekwangia sp.]|uniref:chorismate-binding protein n=1 Tax=Ohtaekwangia sp. TaxID=2066019 RepID=UPI002F92D029